MKVINNLDGTVTLVTEIVLSPEQINMLKLVDSDGYAEFRDFGETEFSRDGRFNEEICMELCSLGLLESDDDSWHFTLLVSNKGKEVISKI